MLETVILSKLSKNIAGELCMGRYLLSAYLECCGGQIVTLSE